VFDEGARLFTVGEITAPAVILLLSLKYGVGGKSRFDWACLIVAGATLSLLLLTHDVLISLLLALFVDAIGTLLTIRKLKLDPFSESRSFWGIDLAAAMLAILSLKEYTVVALLFPVYVAVSSALILSYTKPAAAIHNEAIKKL
jgi:hypothetical protein